MALYTGLLTYTVLDKCQYMQVMMLPVVTVIHLWCIVVMWISTPLVYTLLYHNTSIHFQEVPTPRAFLLYAWQQKNLLFPAKAMKSLDIPRGVKRVLFRTLNTDRYIYIKLLIYVINYKYVSGLSMAHKFAHVPT